MIGVGGFGVLFGMYFVAVGVGWFGIVDFDVVDYLNF